MSGSSYEIALPWPPSANASWRCVSGRTLLTSRARTYRSTVKKLVAINRPPAAIREAHLAVELRASAPDRRRRDIDNIAKQILDALGHAGVYDDDSQIDRLTISRLHPGTGSVLVHIDDLECESCRV